MFHEISHGFHALKVPQIFWTIEGKSTIYIYTPAASPFSISIKLPALILPRTYDKKIQVWRGWKASRLVLWDPISGCLGGIWRVIVIFPIEMAIRCWIIVFSTNMAFFARTFSRSTSAVVRVNPVRACSRGIARRSRRISIKSRFHFILCFVCFQFKWVENFQSLLVVASDGLVQNSVCSFCVC